MHASSTCVQRNTSGWRTPDTCRPLRAAPAHSRSMSRWHRYAAVMPHLTWASAPPGELHCADATFDPLCTTLAACNYASAPPDEPCCADARCRPLCAALACCTQGKGKPVRKASLQILHGSVYPGSSAAQLACGEVLLATSSKAGIALHVRLLPCLLACRELLLAFSHSRCCSCSNPARVVS